MANRTNRVNTVNGNNGTNGTNGTNGNSRGNTITEATKVSPKSRIAAVVHETSIEITDDMTLSEVIRIARNSAVKKPEVTPKRISQLRKIANCVVSYHSADHRSNLFVYDNGFAGYETDGRTTAIDLDEIFAVKFPSDVYSCEVTAEYIKNLPWHVALTLLGEERVAQNIFDDPAHEFITEEDDEGSTQNLNKPAFAVHIDDPETAYIRRETQNEIKMALSKARAQMTVKQAEAFALYYDQDMTMKEVGTILGISFHSVEDRLEGAKQKIHKCMEPFL